MRWNLAWFAVSGVLPYDLRIADLFVLLTQEAPPPQGPGHLAQLARDTIGCVGAVLELTGHLHALACVRLAQGAPLYLDAGELAEELADFFATTHQAERLRPALLGHCERSEP